jgi:SAM-dependent methyltransferase
MGLTSGSGSYGELASYKADVVNAFVRAHDVDSVIELGCGDGNQLALAEYPRYLGLDVSKRAVETCIDRFQADGSKAFLWYDASCAANIANFLHSDLVISLDVVYHLLEDRTYERYLQDAFSMAERFVIIYSSNHVGGDPAAHVRHRRFTPDVESRFPRFRLIEHKPNPHADKTFAEFFFYERTG